MATASTRREVPGLANRTSTHRGFFVTELTAERVRELLNYDPETGIFTWRTARSGCTLNKAAGTRHSEGYISIRIDRRPYFAHRLVWLHVHGDWPQDQIDHINGVRGDNRLANLRDVAPSINKQNLRGAPANSKSGLIGAYWDKENRNFKSSIKLYGKSINIGRFTTVDEAHQAYLTAKRQLHSGCTI